MAPGGRERDPAESAPPASRENPVGRKIPSKPSARTRSFPCCTAIALAYNPGSGEGRPCESRVEDSELIHDALETVRSSDGERAVLPRQRNRHAGAHGRHLDAVEEPLRGDVRPLRNDAEREEVPLALRDGGTGPREDECQLVPRRR